MRSPDMARHRSPICCSLGPLLLFQAARSNNYLIPRLPTQRLARIHGSRFEGIHSSCDGFFPTLVRSLLLDSGTTGLIGPDPNLKQRVNTVDHLHIYAILHVPALDRPCVYIELIIVPSHALWA
jgi:hypothetical protein